MKLAAIRRSRSAALPGITAVARLDRRTRVLAGRIRPGEIAVIDHVDLDRAAAELLVAARVGAVVNAAPSISGRYPTLGPQVLLAAGVPLLDSVGEGVFTELSDGQRVRLHDDGLYVGERQVVTGVRHDERTVAAAMDRAKTGLATQLEAFAANTSEYMRRERELLLDGVGIPRIATELAGRQCLVVVKGFDCKADLRALRRYIRDVRPVLIGVDDGADALLEAGLRPDLIVGDVASVSDRALTCGAEVVVHTPPSGAAPGLDRVQDLGVRAVPFAAAARAEDVALLLADWHGAALVVAVGTHATLTEFLDQGRSGAASTFLTRLRVGGKLVDGKAVSRLHRSPPPVRSLLAVLLVLLVGLSVVLAVTPAGHSYVRVLSDLVAQLSTWIGSLRR